MTISYLIVLYGFAVYGVYCFYCSATAWAEDRRRRQLRKKRERYLDATTVVNNALDKEFEEGRAGNRAALGFHEEN